MPIYEYHCRNCQQRISLFFRSFSEVERTEPTCSECGSQDLERLISNVAVHGTKQTPPSPQKQDSEGPRALARTMREASGHGKKDFGDDFKEVASRLEKGESPTSIEKALRKRVGESMSSVH